MSIPERSEKGDPLATLPESPTIPRRTADIAKLINELPLSRLQITVIVLCGLLAFLEGYDVQSLAYVAPVLAPDLGISTSALGTVFSVFLVGYVVSGFVLGPAADRFGRRWILIGSTFVFALGSLATVFASNVTTLLICRLVTGLGIGGAMTLVALAAEYTPARLRSTAGMIMLAGLPLGSVAGGLISAQLIPRFGWHSVFAVGGILPIVLTVVLIFLLPESPRFLVARFDDGERAAKIMRRIVPAAQLDPDVKYVVAREEKRSGSGVGSLFTGGRALMTIALWVAMFASLAAMYFLLSWIPSMLTGAGMTLSTAILSGTVFSLGGIVGAVVLGAVMDRSRRPAVVLCVSTVIAIGSILVLPSVLHVPLASFIFIFLLGIGVIGTNAGVINLSGLVYPTLIRSTGVGWAGGVGRIGSIISPLVGGFLIAAGWSAQNLFSIVIIPVVAYFAALFVLGVRRSTLPPSRGGAE